MNLPEIPNGYVHAYQTKDLFHKIKYKGLDKLAKHRNMSVQDACAEIFNIVLSDIVLDIVQNNVTFVLPLDYGKYGELCVEEIDQEKFIEKYKEGFYQKVDFVKSNFTGHCLTYRFKNRLGQLKTSWIRTTGYLFNEMLDRTHAGKHYY